MQKELIADLTNDNYTVSFDDIFLTPKNDDEYYEKYFKKLKEKARGRINIQNNVAEKIN